MAKGFALIFGLIVTLGLSAFSVGGLSDGIVHFTGWNPPMVRSMEHSFGRNVFSNVFLVIGLGFLALLVIHIVRSALAKRRD